MGLRAVSPIPDVSSSRRAFARSSFVYRETKPRCPCSPDNTTSNTEIGNVRSKLLIWGTIFTANIVFNLIFGFVGDKVGWRNTIIWFGGVGCGITTLLFYYSPQFSAGNFWVVMAAGVLWGALLAGYVPLSALMPSLVKKDKGAAVSVLNLGAGLPVFVGPAIVGVFYRLVGGEGVVWILAGLYFFGAFLTKFITLPGNAKTV